MPPARIPSAPARAATRRPGVVKPTVLLLATFSALACAQEQPAADTAAEPATQPSLAEVLADGEWIDLTHALNEDTPFWPTSRGFEKTTVFEGHTEGGWYYTAYDIATSEHGGTHLDAPIHFAEGRHATDEIPVERLVGPAVVIDVSAKASDDRDYQISPDDVTGWEEEHGPIPDGAIVLFDTGSAADYWDIEAYMGTAERGEEAVAKLHFPGIHPDTASLLATERTIDAVGIDTPSIDYGQSQDFASHVALYQQNVPGFENVANLDRLPATGAYVFALPVKIEGGSGGPLRIVAFVPRSDPR